MHILQPSDAERTRRQRAVQFLRGSIALSGCKLTPEAEVLNERFIAGELTDSDYFVAFLDHARSLPSGEQTQAYVTTLEELERAMGKLNR